MIHDSWWKPGYKTLFNTKGVLTMGIDKKTVAATMLVYAIARGVIDEVKPDEQQEVSNATDAVVFDETMKAIHNKGLEVSNGK